MPLEDIISRRITGIAPFNELPIDAEIWREAHNHHQLHRRLHAVAAHRPGIVYGLEVVPSQSKETTVVVAPGVATDSEGRTIILPDAVTLDIVETRQIYIILAFQNNKDRGSAVTVGGGTEYYREVEGHLLISTKDLPNTPYLELARVFRTGADKAIKQPANAFDPGSDELNLLYRPIAFPHCYADVAIGELSYVGKTEPGNWKPNRGGLYNLMREGNGAGFHLTFSGTLNLQNAGDAADPCLLYVAGRQGFQPRTDAETDGLKRYLDGGGLLFGEAAQGNAEFAAGFQELAGKLGAKLKKVPKNHPLLTAHHVFSSPPPGGRAQGELLLDADAGVMLSSFDYGGAWQGDVEQPDAPDARDHIRQAQEFGLNVVAYAASRRRVRQLSRLG
ncbi:MAG: DUF4159 domain-containing protein [Armatimonadota bacterium]|nr:DUF4159 domain-containing protein [Armatimonadota bacterium]